MTEQAIKNNATFDEIHRLVTDCLEGSAADSVELLETFVSETPEALDLYLEYLRDSIGLRYIASPLKDIQIECTILDAISEPSAVSSSTVS